MYAKKKFHVPTVSVFNMSERVCLRAGYVFGFHSRVYSKNEWAYTHTRIFLPLLFYKFDFTHCFFFSSLFYKLFYFPEIFLHHASPRGKHPYFLLLLFLSAVRLRRANLLPPCSCLKAKKSRPGILHYAFTPWTMGRGENAILEQRSRRAVQGGEIEMKKFFFLLLTRYILFFQTIFAQRQNEGMPRQKVFHAVNSGDTGASVQNYGCTLATVHGPGCWCVMQKPRQRSRGV